MSSEKLDAKPCQSLSLPPDVLEEEHRGHGGLLLVAGAQGVDTASRRRRGMVVLSLTDGCQGLLLLLQ